MTQLDRIEQMLLMLLGQTAPDELGEELERERAKVELMKKRKGKGNKQ